MRELAWDGGEGGCMVTQNIEVSFELPEGEEEEAIIPGGGLPWQLILLAVLALAAMGGKR